MIRLTWQPRSPILASLAYLPVFLVSGLCLYSIGWQSPVGRPHVSEHIRGFRAEWTLARRRLEIYHLGLLHGFYLVMEQIWSRATAGSQSQVTEKIQQNSLIGRRANQILTFALVTLTWVFFRAATTPDALLILGKILTFSFIGPIQLAIQPVEFAFCIALIGLLLLEKHWIDFIRQASNRPFWLVVPALLLICYFFGVFTVNQFIYFQF